MDFAFNIVSVREEPVKEKSVLEKPIPLADPNLHALQVICQKYIDALDKGHLEDANKLDHYIFEIALETLFGKNVWDYVNAKMK